MRRTTFGNDRRGSPLSFSRCSSCIKWVLASLFNNVISLLKLLLRQHHADISFDDSKFSIKVTTHQTRPAFIADHTSSHSPRATPKSPKTPSPHGLTGRDLVLGLSMQSAILDIGAMTSEELAERS